MSKRQITKDGKVSLWPFVETKLAKRKCKNRDRGSHVTVPMSVTKPIYRNYLIDKVFPAIQAKGLIVVEDPFLCNKTMQNRTWRWMTLP
ncbi:hypothetical protein H310_02790 [Aphanomyces invadans]|uniref:Uncharacterized protein n=1 Tax=Aphanomyces invadans TaxID=157072 RepID=A0A024ULS9_9STRA|nr:hypothetical protein H310_02790 [Aphanomyces invadans]ETW06573.1 hypothetical protein H310_02790 [Aphanomyces invadans]|eukprot:XP_008864648.1 hypothetical protein H310_02790 [Aphanomyces invadans]